MPTWTPLIVTLLLLVIVALVYILWRRPARGGAVSVDVKERQQQALTAALMENAIEGFVTINDSGIVQSFNPAAERIFGYSAAEVIGNNVILLMTASDQKEHDQYIANYLATGEAKIIGIGREVTGRRKSGQEFPMDLSVSEVIVDGERSFAGIVRDVSERVLFLREIEASRLQLRQIIDLVPHMIFAKDAQGRFLLANQAVADFYQRSVDGVLGQAQEHLHDTDSELLDMLSDDKRVLTNDDPLMVPEQRLTDNRGCAHIMQTYKMPLEFGADKTPAVLGVAVDVTELKVNEDRLQTLIQNAPVAISVCQFGGAIVTSNTALQRLTGYTEDELGKLTLEDVSDPQDWPESRRLAQAALASANANYIQRMRYVTKDNRKIEVEVYSTVSRNSEDEPEFLIVQVLDLTERLLSERQVREAEAQLEQAGRLALIGEMAAGIAHEINQPIAAISIFAQAGKRYLQEQRYERLTEVFDKVSSQVQRVGDTVARMQRLAKHQKPDLKPQDVNELIEDVCTVAAMDNKLKDENLQLSLAEKLPPIHCDAAQIQQVILNLVRNAAEAMQRHCEQGNAAIIIASSDLGNMVEIAVIDSGEGVSTADCDAIFTPFATSKQGRIGMGLPICRYIVNAHEGRLNYRSNAEGGATFFFTLPVNKAHDE